MRVITPIIFLGIAVVVFFSLIQPFYADSQKLRADHDEFATALERAQELKAVREQLTAKYDSFSAEDIDRLHRLLPDNINNVRLVLDIDALAEKHKLFFSQIKADQPEQASVNGANGAGAGMLYGTATLSFSLAGTYDDFLAFMVDLERSLRLVDLEMLDVTAGEGSVYDYSVTLRTYWLR